MRLDQDRLMAFLVKSGVYTSEGELELLDGYGRMLFLLSNLRSLNRRRPVDLLREGDAQGAKKAVLDNLWS